MANGVVYFKTQPWTLTLPSIFQSNSYADVSFECEGKQIKVHKTILASQSPFFRKLFLSAESPLENPILLLEGFRYDILVLLVSFLYNGRVEGSSEDLITLSKYGKELQIEGLVNSGRTTQPLQLELLEQKKIKVNEQLCLLQDSNSDSETSESAEEDELIIVFEKTKCEDKRALSSGSESVTIPELLKRPLSPSSSISTNGKRRYQKSNKSDSSSKAADTISSENRTIKCRMCREVCQNKQDFRSHLAEKHAENLTCSICRKLFTARSSLKTHLKNHINKLDNMINFVPTTQLDSNP